MSILEQIVQQKRKEVKQKKMLYPVKLLERSEHFSSPVVSLKSYLTQKQKSGIIAEIKRSSPSRGVLNKYISVEQTSIGYMRAGASALSILTDEPFFSGTNNDLIVARQFNYCPILRKDFIIDEYQVIESRAIGADAVLLIASILSDNEIRHLSGIAKALDLEIILEVHTKEELNKVNNSIDIVGVNNRDLATFVTDIERSIALYDHIPKQFVKISESGIHTPEIAYKLKKKGFDGLLIGEQFMTHSQPGHTCAQFINELKQLYAGEDMRAQE
ncbi:MAG: indole-3-glycerol phosphate synthase TrpC [Flavipsychrobacter sp.]|nr:indole-3-glycerol phosphate synthase TrpC [Flavipsychrobacter sp.]